MTVASVRKALAPAVLALAAVVTDWIVSGDFDVSQARTIAAGVVTVVVVYLVRNEP